VRARGRKGGDGMESQLELDGGGGRKRASSSRLLLEELVQQDDCR